MILVLFSLQIVDEDTGSLQNIAYGYADDDDGPTVAEVTYDCAQTKFRDEQKPLGTKWKKTVENSVDSELNTGDGGSLTKRYDSDSGDLPVGRKSVSAVKFDTASGSPPRRQRMDSDESPEREPAVRDTFNSSVSRKKDKLIHAHSTKKERFDSDESLQSRKRFDSDESPPRQSRLDSDESPPRKSGFDSDESPPRKKRVDSDESPPRKSNLYNSNDSDASPSRKTICLRKETQPEKKLTTAEYLLARKRGKLKKDSAEEAMRKQREESLQRAAEEKHKLWNKGITQVEQSESRLADIQHEMTKSFARSAKDEDLNDMFKSKMLAEDPMFEYLSKKNERQNGSKPKRPVYQGPFPANRFNIRPGYRWDGVDRSNGFEQEYFGKLSSKAAVEEDAYKYCAEDIDSSGHTARSLLQTPVSTRPPRSHATELPTPHTITNTPKHRQNVNNNATHDVTPSHQRTRNATYRVQFRKIDINTPKDRQNFFETTVYHLNVPLIRLAENDTGYHAVTDKTTAIDELTSPKATQLFKKINLKPITPPELHAKRTIFVCQLDSSIGQLAPDFISKEIAKHQPWAKTPEISKIKYYTHVIKITFTDITTTEKVLQNRLMIFNTKIMLTQIELKSRKKLIHIHILPLLQVQKSRSTLMHFHNTPLLGMRFT
ncbi:Bud13 [Trinorchestia longiramus]|nr:Bud13 [Trinorchestia longiramus]